MKSKYFLFKKSAAPLIFTFLQIYVLTITCININEMLNFSKLEIVLFWINIPLVFTTYILTYLRDPGFIPLDFVPLTESSYRHEILKAKELNNSLGLNISQINKSKDFTQLEIIKTDHDFKVKNKQTLEKKELFAIENIAKNNDNLEKIQAPRTPIIEENDKNLSNRPDDLELHENIDELVCEPSFDNENPNDSKSKNKPILDNNNILKQMDEENLNDYSFEMQIHKKNPGKIPDNLMEKMVLISDKTKTISNDTTKANTLTSTCATKLEIINNTTKPNLESPLCKNEEKNIDFEANKEKEKTQAVDKIVSSLTKDFKKLDEKLSSEEIDNHKNNEIYVERRYCTICNIEQPIRSKHCKECKRCVALYDHHCPWMGNCIGEKNHFFFIVFLIFQINEIIWSIKIIIDWLIESDLEIFFHSSILNIICGLISIICILFFFIMVILLLFFHIYLATKNLTTWENLSWNKISYLREIPEKMGSPFSSGICTNLKLFLKMNFTNNIMKWQLTRKNSKI